MGRDRNHQIMQRLVNEVGKCELCGSTRRLECHHIIPVVCGGDDNEDNLLVVCSSCHATLTPRGALTRIGIEHVRTENKIREAFQDFFQRVDDMIDGNYSLRAADVLDLVLDRLMYNVLAILDKESPNADALIKERGGDDDS